MAFVDENTYRRRVDSEGDQVAFVAVRHTEVAMVHTGPLSQVFCHTDLNGHEGAVADTWMDMYPYPCQIGHTAKVVAVAAGVLSSYNRHCRARFGEVASHGHDGPREESEVCDNPEREPGCIPHNEYLVRTVQDHHGTQGGLSMVGSHVGVCDR